MWEGWSEKGAPGKKVMDFQSEEPRKNWLAVMRVSGRDVAPSHPSNETGRERCLVFWKEDVASYCRYSTLNTGRRPRGLSSGCVCTAEKSRLFIMMMMMVVVVM